ncbi:AzlD domain-containing protein [Pengzhenrongella sicca]|nr:AzlD domain-containing protein [Pengzhenrongella sicca]
MSTFAMTWWAILAASAVCFALKLAGHLVPDHWLSQPRVARTAALVTVALLAALVGVQTMTAGHQLVVDARLPALAVAAGALALRAPFVVVVLAAAATAAVLRALGM